MTKTLPLSEVKTHLPELVSKVMIREDQIVVTRHGKPVAVLLSYDEYESLKETLDVLSDPALVRQVHKSLAYFAKGGRGKSFEDVFKEPLTPRHSA